MSFQGLTPESLLDRSDSKNPATTCKGLTTSGRPCRRSLGSTPGQSPNATPTKRAGHSNNEDALESDQNGVVAIIDSGNAAAFFCWQHKDQAQNLIAKIERLQQQQQQQQQRQHQQTRIIPLQKRSSIDTLIERVGVIDLDRDVDEGNQRAGQTRKPVPGRVKKRDTLPVEWQNIQGPLMSVPEEIVDEVVSDPYYPRRPSRANSRSRPRPRPSQSWQKNSEKHDRPVVTRPKTKAKKGWSCCGSIDAEYNDDGPPARRRERYDDENRRRSRSQSRQRSGGGVNERDARPTSYRDTRTSISGTQSYMQRQMQGQYQQRASQSHAIGTREQERNPRRDQVQPQRQQYPVQQVTPSRPRPTLNPTPDTSTPPHSQTSHFLSLIPPHLDPPTTSALLAELSKPFAKDDDAGYIYIYWLTPSSNPTIPNTEQQEQEQEQDEDKPDDDIASTILDSDSDSDSASDGTPRTSKQQQPPYTIHSRHTSSNHSSNHNHNHTTHQQSLRRTAALNRYASIKAKPTTNTPPKILLKIGRATNVHRRMTQWSKQCGQNITLVRYYPYRSGSQSQAQARLQAGDESPKVPHVNKVERLIHIELRGMGMGRLDGAEKCGVCGRGHREWFEVEASKEGLKGVDAVVRRWVEWAERSESTTMRSTSVS